MENTAYAAGLNALLATCKERNVAFQTIKSLSSGPWNGHEKTRATWYKPFEDQDKIDTVVHWVLSNPDVFLNSVGDIYVLPKVLDAASRFEESMKQADFADAIAQMEVEPLFT
jgi:hypothetical protein